MATGDQAGDDHGRAFDLASKGYDSHAVRGLADTARGLVAVAGPQRGDRVLDIATGTGWAALAAAVAVGQGGQVVGVDIADGMLDKARQKAGAAGIKNVEFRKADATKLPFEDGTFDMAIAASCLFFMPDMAAAAREWARVVKPGGKVAFSCFGEACFQPMMDRFEEEVRKAGVGLPPGSRPFPWQGLKGAADARAQMDAAGLRPLQVETAQVGYYLSTKEDLWEFVMGTGMRGSVERLPEASVPAFKEKFLGRAWTLAVESGLWIDICPVYAVGRRP